MIDYGAGNIVNVVRAFEKISAKVIVLDSPEGFEKCTHLVLPGVGAFPYGMKNLKDRGLIEPIIQSVNANKPFLGICLGMQLLSTVGMEYTQTLGLDLIPGEVVSLNTLPISSKFKAPNMGWCTTDFSFQESHLQEPKMSFYYAHSFVFLPTRSDFVEATANIFGTQITSVIRANNILGVQFHPEKSGNSGLTFLSNWLFDSFRGSKVRS